MTSSKYRARARGKRMVAAIWQACRKIWLRRFVFAGGIGARSKSAAPRRLGGGCALMGLAGAAWLKATDLGGTNPHVATRSRVDEQDPSQPGAARRGLGTAARCYGSSPVHVWQRAREVEKGGFSGKEHPAGGEKWTSDRSAVGRVQAEACFLPLTSTDLDSRCRCE